MIKIRNPRDRVYLLIGSALVVGTVLIVFRLLRHSDIQQDAINALQAVIHNEPAAYFDYCNEFDIQRSGLTRDQYIALWNKLVWPRFSKFKPVGTLGQEKYGNHQAVAWVKLRDAAGREYEYSEAPFAIEDGSGRVQSLYHPLMQAWILEYVVEKGKPVSPSNVIEAYITGCTIDRAELIALGAEKFSFGLEQGPAYSWDEIIARWRKRLADLTKPRLSNSR